MSLLSIVVPVHRNRDSVLHLLTSILRQHEPPDFEVWVICNPADSVLASRIEAMDVRIRCLQSDVIGANTARNLGLRHLRGEVILFLDDDCVVSDPLFLSNHLEAHRRYPTATAVGGPYALPQHANRLQRAYHEVQQRWLHSARRGGESTVSLLGGNVSFKFARLGGHRFDEKLCYGGTETELFLRMGREGHRFFLLPTLTIEHESRLSWKAFVRKAFAQGSGAAYLAGLGHRIEYYAFEPECEVDLRWIVGLYELAFEAGRRYQTQTSRTWASGPQIAFRLLLAVLQRYRNPFRSGFFSEVFFCLRALLSTRYQNRKVLPDKSAEVRGVGRKV